MVAAIIKKTRSGRNYANEASRKVRAMVSVGSSQAFDFRGGEKFRAPVAGLMTLVMVLGFQPEAAQARGLGFGGFLGGAAAGAFLGGLMAHHQRRYVAHGGGGSRRHEHHEAAASHQKRHVRGKGHEHEEPEPENASASVKPDAPKDMTPVRESVAPSPVTRDDISSAGVVRPAAPSPGEHIATPNGDGGPRAPNDSASAVQPVKDLSGGASAPNATGPAAPGAGSFH